MPYTEEVAPHAFEVPKVGVPLVLEDDDHAIGQAVSFADRLDGLYARCRLGRNDEPTIRDLIGNGMLTGLAPVFAPVRSRQAGRVVVRERARLLAVALCRWAVYPGARLTISATMGRVAKVAHDPGG